MSGRGKLDGERGRRGIPALAAVVGAVRAPAVAAAPWAALRRAARVVAAVARAALAVAAVAVGCVATAGAFGARAAAAPAPKAAARPAAAAAPAAAVEHQTYGRFGQVAIYRRVPAPSGVVVLVSGEAGWDARADELARDLASLDALVIGLDLPFYLRKMDRLTEDCSYPAGDLEMLSKLVQKKLDLHAYTPPVVAGFGAGATLAYGALAQAPSGTFAGAISLGFCPDLAVSHPLCPGRGLASQALAGGESIRLQPAASVDQPWLVGPPPEPGAAAACAGGKFPQAADEYAAKVKGAAAVAPPKGSGHHQASPELRAASALKQSYLRVLNSADLAHAPESQVRKSLAELPLLELPQPGSTGDTMAVIVSGDGGWAGLDRDVASQLAERGIPVVGLNSLQYFWTPRNPETAAADLARILRTYLAAWKRKDALLVGYSLGAEVLPFMVDHLPAEVQSKVRMVALLGPGRTTSFEFRLSEWLGHGGGENRPVAPEVAKLRGKPLLCVYGSAEKGSSLCTILAPSLAVSVALPGAHYLGSNPRAVVTTILRHLNGEPEPAPAAAPKRGTGAGGAGGAAADKAAEPGKKREPAGGQPPPAATPPPPGGQGPAGARTR